jgi:hypothetical protein
MNIFIRGNAAVVGYGVSGTGFTSEFSAFSPRSPLDVKLAFDEDKKRSFGCWTPFQV